MTMKPWIRSWFARPVRRPIRKGPRCARVALEELEDRFVPSRLFGTGFLDDGSAVGTDSNPSALRVFPNPHSAAAFGPAAGGNSSPIGIPYHGGSLLTHVQVQGMYYNEPITLGLQSQLDGFFTDILQSSWMTQLLASYGVGNQTIGAGSFLGDDNLGLSLPQDLTDDDLRHQLSSEVANGRLAAPNDNTLYAVFLPPSSNPVPGALAYHDAFIDPISGKAMYYMVMYAPVYPNLTEFQNLTELTSHELSESITDPGQGLTTPAHPDGDWAWLSGEFGEVADIAENNDVTYHGYTMQDIWAHNPTDPPFLALGPATAPADTDFADSWVLTNPTEGNNYGVFATFTDKDGAAEPPGQFKVQVAWGDGTSSRSDDGSGNVTVTSNGDGTFNVVGRHSYRGNAGTTYGQSLAQNSRGASVSVSSGDEFARRLAPPITLREAGPLTTTSAHSFLFAAGQALTNQVVATFTDPGGTDGADPDTSEYQASINWGDGTPNDTNVTIWPNGNGSYSILGNRHVYTNASGSPYQVSVTIMNNGTTNVVVGQAMATVPTTFTVTSLLDDGSVGTLRWAVGQANGAVGLTTINFAPSLFGSPQTIHLTGAPIELSNTSATESLVGPAAGVTVSGDGLSGVFQVDAGVNASLAGLTITRGKTAGSGGGLDNEGGIVALTCCTVSGNTAGLNGGGVYSYLGFTRLTNCTVSGNSARSSGGGLFNYGAASLTGCTVTGNAAVTALGGGLYNFGTATLTNCTVSGNHSTRSGGGLLNEGTATLTDCTVSGNATGRFGGGLFSSYYAATVLNNCTVSGNDAARSGGGLSTRAGPVTLTNCTISGNNAATWGGGVYLSFGGKGTLTNCTVSGNNADRAGGGVMNWLGCEVTLTNCAVSGNATTDFGGGLLSAGIATLTNCTVNGNSAIYYGGGFLSEVSEVTLTNCTVSGNSASVGGGVEIYYGDTTLTDCTVSGNTAAFGGAGLYGLSSIVFGGQLALTNTIVAGNGDASDAASDILGSAVGTNNLIGTGGAGGLVNGVDGNLVGVANPLLAPLGDYGGPTQTMPLLPGSLAIDAGTSTGAPASDQRGQGRVGTVDIGAFESQGFTIAVTSGSGQSTNISSAFSLPLVVTVTANNPSEPVAGGLVTFTPLSSGASATLSGSPATLSAAGKASVTATATGFAGSYTVSAMARGVTTPASVSLSNRPTLTVPSALTASQNVDQSLSGVSIGDAPGATVTVTLSVGHGTLTLGATTGLTTVTGNGTGTVTLTGTTANLNAALASLVYRGLHNYSGGDAFTLTATDSGVSAVPASVALTVESIAQEEANLQAQVTALQTAGVLNQGQANSLIVKLTLKGNNGDIGKVQAFLNEVQADLTAGILTQAQANVLLGLGNILLLSVTRR